ncbi:Ig-like protein group 2 [Paenibacillus taihuensis]|uniref:Ig-like protein group 2 n=1 Tax=Paenibacillus taihuensis TaxID=1156355 RepID=A0A3D9QZX0_9BACL|nr:DUF5057 domain-containing protein [Paenibacillus taihuensis]REE66677.1 Ig-like protein group 2 [Paenibacillus taihuensis]
MSAKMRKLIVRLVLVCMVCALIAIPEFRGKAYADSTVYYAIKAGTNKFLTVGSGNVLTASTTSSGTAAEQFELISNSDNTYSIKSKLTGKYVTASSTSSPLQATSTTIGSLQKFKKSNDYLIATINKNDKYVFVDEDNGSKLYASKNKSSDATKLYFSKDVTKLLEITDSGDSDLQDELGSLPNVSIDTVSMKRFVALRGDLDGSYDAIYIGKGNYNPNRVALTTTSNRDAAHATKNLENDITMLKAKEIVNQFILKGQLVLLYSDSSSKSGLLYQGTIVNSKFVASHGNLYDTFAPYYTAKRDNVIFLDATGLNNLYSRFSTYTELLHQRPKLVLSNQPTSYLINPSTLYHAGDRLTFGFNVPNYSDFGQGTLTANLYLGLDKAAVFGNNQIVASASVTNQEGEISYTLPKGYSGLFYWKLEIIDQQSKLSSYETGVFRYRDQVTNVRVLQIMANDSDVSSLKKSTNLTQSYLSSTGEYNITITTMKFSEFNASDKSGLNGSYDMLIFGFADSYNANASITDATADVVNNFIKTGQSVMFTHDTVFSSSGTDRNTWINKFQQTTGQIEPWTNLGFGAPSTSTSVQKVNDGLLTQFPFNLDDATPTVATTHNQYFTLDLEDSTVVPWYNITGGSRNDTNDSWNDYYTYSKGNVTYSGTGHTNTGFPDWEQKLFVNTMYRAYMGSNHAPLLTVYNPVDYSAAQDNFIPSYQPINLSFMPEDYDFADRNLTVQTSYTYNNGSGATTKNLDPLTVVSGSTANQVIPNPFTGDGDLTISITVTDKTGAKATKTVPVKIKKISSNLTVQRTITGGAVGSGGEIVMERGTTASLNYSATPKPIANSGSVNASSLKIQGITFNETLPAGLEVVGTLPNGLTKSGDVNSGYTISGTFNTISYSLAADGKNYIASPINFSITVKPTVTGTLPLNRASLAFKDVGQTTSMTLPYDSYTINSIVKVDNLSISVNDLTLVNRRDSTGAMVYDTATVIPTYTPADATPRFSWTSSKPSVASIITTNAGNGFVTAASTGETTITVIDAITGKSASAKVTVLESGLNIIGDDTVSVGSTIDLKRGIVKPNRETEKSIQWSVYNPSDATLSTSTGLQTKLTGLKAGTVTVTVHVETTYVSAIDGSTVTNTYDATKQIKIENPDLKLSGAQTAGVGDKISLTAALLKAFDQTPIADSSIVQNVSWSSSNTSIAKVTADSTGKQLTNELQAKSPGNVTVSVTVILPGGPLTKDLPIVIQDRKPAISGTSVVKAGNSITDLNVTWSGSAGAPSFNYLPEWTISGSHSASITIDPATGKLQTGPNDSGTVTIVMTIHTPAGVDLIATKQIDIVNIVPPQRAELFQGDTMNLADSKVLIILPERLRDSIVTGLQWSSDNSNIVTVTQAGDITGKRKGTATITIYEPKLGMTFKVPVTVTNTDKY